MFDAKQNCGLIFPPPGPGLSAMIVCRQAYAITVFHQCGRVGLISLTLQREHLFALQITSATPSSGSPALHCFLFTSLCFLSVGEECVYVCV